MNVRGSVILRDFTATPFLYGLIDWEQFYDCLRNIIVSPIEWAVFRYDENTSERHEALCPPGPEFPEPGTYIILSPTGTPITIGLTAVASRRRHPIDSNTASRRDAYQQRVQARDPCCLITGLVVQADDYSRFKAAHIFPRAHDIEWSSRGFPSCITDRAPLIELGGPSKIDSVQNVILLRGDLHDAWGNYRLSVNPDCGYIVVPFLPGYDDVAGRRLKLDHIADPTLRPLDELFRDHFFQAVMKNMKGGGEPNWDYEEALDDGVMDLSRTDIWGDNLGREHLEFELAHRLHDIIVSQTVQSS